MTVYFKDIDGCKNLFENFGASKCLQLKGSVNQTHLHNQILVCEISWSWYQQDDCFPSFQRTEVHVQNCRYLRL